MTSTEAGGGEATVTQRLLAAAPSRGEHRALVGGPADPAYGYAELAATVQAAAAGLAWRGLQPRDVVGVYVPDAACYVLAAHAIRAAGGVPSPVAAGLAVPEIAGQLADCRARMLLTAPPLDAAALEAADRSWVRQVISFGETPDAIQFCALLTVGTLTAARARGVGPSGAPEAHRSGAWSSGGSPGAPGGGGAPRAGPGSSATGPPGPGGGPPGPWGGVFPPPPRCDRPRSPTGGRAAPARRPR